jgi:hypothetical protein
VPRPGPTPRNPHGVQWLLSLAAGSSSTLASDLSPPFVVLQLEHGVCVLALVMFACANLQDGQGKGWEIVEGASPTLWFSRCFGSTDIVLLLLLFRRHQHSGASYPIELLGEDDSCPDWPDCCSKARSRTRSNGLKDSDAVVAVRYQASDVPRWFAIFAGDRQVDGRESD